MTVSIKTGIIQYLIFASDEIFSKTFRMELTDSRSADDWKTGEYFDDSVITSKIKAAILQEPTLSSAEINVETFQGKVQLSGGVKSVKNAMQLK